jgi:hypothetical protein
MPSEKNLHGGLPGFLVMGFMQTRNYVFAVVGAARLAPSP